MEDVGYADETPEMEEDGLADNAKRERAIVKIAGRRLCDDGEIEFGCAVRRAELGKATGKRQDDSLNAADTRREEV